MSEMNPYASPAVAAEAIQHPMAGEQMVLATRGERFVNVILDGIIIQVLSGAVGFVIGMLYGASVAASGGQIGAEDETMMNIIGFAIGIATGLGYYIIAELSGQRTLGKLVTGTRVVAADGGRATAGQIIGRTFARYIPFEAFSFLSPQRPVGWHDSLSGTRVVKVSTR